ncbi:hypothetical protein [Streptomyces sp. NPDC048192]|uniref:hypothetical protein n=1 Tax=Streptomyces sp. NPDC048192 TaxID=3365510 RepID=UPI003710E4D0
MSTDWFENPAVRRHFGRAGLDWKVICAEQDDETENTEEPPPAQVSEDGSTACAEQDQHDMT